MLVYELRKKVCEANKMLPKHGLVKFTWGNVSEIDREQGYIVIKPSGVDYDLLTPENMVVTDLDGNVVEGNLNPSSDLKTHVVLYKKYLEIGGIVHTHSTFAASFAQAGRDIPAYGTTHADYFYGDIPCARNLTREEVEADYELETGNVIVETLLNRNINVKYIPGLVVRNHGPFAWGKDANEAVYHAVVMEEVAKMVINTELVNPNVQRAPQYMLDKHFMRKHGKNAYYGQKNI